MVEGPLEAIQLLPKDVKSIHKVEMGNQADVEYKVDGAQERV